VILQQQFKMLHLILLIYFAILSTVSAGVLENTPAMLVVIVKLFVFFMS